jgi:hypothetical protein
VFLSLNAGSVSYKPKNANLSTINCQLSTTQTALVSRGALRLRVFA